MAQTLDSLALDIKLNVSGLEEVRQVQRRMQGMDRQIKRSGQAMNQFGRAATGAGRDTNRFAMGVLQQAGYQIGDYYVQVANGTSAMQAFGQQGAQLLGIFGPIGAVLGAGVAIFSAFAVAAERSTAATENLTGAQRDLLDVLRELEGISLRDDLFVGMATEAIAELEPLRQFIERGLAQQVREQFRAVREEIGSGVAAAAQEQMNMLQEYQSLLADLEMQAEQQGMTEGIRLAMEDIRNSISGSVEELNRQREAMTIIEGISGRTRQEFVESFATAVRRLETEELITDELNQSLFAFAQANGLASELARILGEAADNAGRVGDELVLAASVQEGLDRMRIERGVAEGTMPPQALADAPLSQAEQTLQRVNEVRRRMAAAAQETMEETSRAGARAVQQVAEVVDPVVQQVESIAKTMESSFERGFMAMVDGTMTVKDAFRMMAADIIRELYRVLVVQRLVGSFTPGAGGTGIVGSIMGALGFRAMGGPMTANRPYVVGERGPEVVVPSRNGTVIPNNQLGGQTPVVVNYTFQGGVTEADLARALPVFVQRTKREIVDAVQRGGSMSRAFG